ncbi:MAG: hypothetical protein M1587_08340, partial [Thaumarchaeota archaeon]|nr:hypothetical protein [Nitrososphaerota archaeon]
MSPKGVERLRSKGKKPEPYNILGTFSLAKLDLHGIAPKIKGAIYVPEAFPSLDVYVSQCLFRLFPNGKSECFGLTESAMKLALEKLVILLKDIGLTVRTPKLSFHSENFIIDVGRKIRLTKALYMLDGSEINATGPRFLKYQAGNPRITYELYENGKIICL